MVIFFFLADERKSTPMVLGAQPFYWLIVEVMHKDFFFTFLFTILDLQ